MNTFAMLITILALAFIETGIMMYQPRTKVGSIVYTLLFIPAAFFLFIGAIVIMQTGG